MTGKIELEARLDRSLRKQVAMPKLDAGFNAAVWQRIAAAEAPAKVRPARASRWLLVSNVLGLGVSLALVLYFVIPAISGVDLQVSVPLPEVSAQTTAGITQGLVWGVTVVAVAFGFAFTRFGRRLLDLFRSEFA